MKFIDMNCNEVEVGDKINVVKNNNLYKNGVIKEITPNNYAYERVVYIVEFPDIGDKIIYAHSNEIEKVEKDKLEEIVEGQLGLLNRIKEERNIDWDINEMLKNHVLALNDEVAELQREIDWKWWVNNKKLEKDNIEEELIDIVFFTLQALLELDNDAEDIYNLYMNKLGENHNRQDGNTDRRGYNPNSEESYENVD